MSEREAALRRRARRALRWYPRKWRARYGEEFTELLMADFDERPHVPGRAVDLAVSATTARLAAAGVAGRTLDPDLQAARSLTAAGGATAVFLVSGVALWSQLAIGWQWAPPATRATAWAMYAMTYGALTLAVLGLAAVVPVAGLTMWRLAHRPSHALVRPLLTVTVGVAILVVGAHHFANGWPGTRGHPWADQGVVPGGVAAYAWASSLSVTSYWMHPGALGAFPRVELAFMLVSPAALLAIVVSATRLVRRLHLPASIVRYEHHLSRVGALAMVAFFTGAALWVVDGAPGPHNLFHVGAIDVLELLAMLGALALAVRSARAARRGTHGLIAA